MRKWKVVSIALVMVLAAGAAGLFNFSEQINPWLATLPGGVQVPETPYHLGLDLQGGVHLVYQADLSKVQENEYDSAMQGLRDIIERRVNFFGVSEPLVQTEGRGEERRLIVELAGNIDAAQAIQLIGQAPFLEFRELPENAQEIVEENPQTDPFQPTGLNGSFLRRAEVAFDHITQEPYITLSFNGEGAELFGQITARNVGRPLAIYLDNIPIQAPIVQTEITGGQAQITGGYTLEEAQGLVRDLNAGAVPVSITLLSQQQVGPTLGALSLQQSLQAAAVGFVALMVCMMLVFRIPGIIASIALILYGLFLLFIFKSLGFTFTLAGIAGFILSLGMAVDANILIFSRLKEELKEGRSFAGAIEEGFRRAWPSIRDGNVTTLLVALILFWLGSSFVQGFALALSIGILLSMFSAIVVTRTFLRLFVGTPLERVRWLWHL